MKRLFLSVSTLILLSYFPASCSINLDEVAYHEPKTLYTMTRLLKKAITHQKSGKGFGAPLSNDWEDPFEHALYRTHQVVSNAVPLSPDKLLELSEMLADIALMGRRLFKRGEMNSHWNLFLHRCMAMLITLTQDINFTSRIDLRTDIIKFDTRQELRDQFKQFKKIHFIKMECMDDLREFYLQTFLPTARKKGWYHLKFFKPKNSQVPIRLRDINNSACITLDCFCLPMIGTRKEILFRFRLISQSLINRIAPVGIPTQRASFDQTLPATSSEFLQHDLDHAQDIFSALLNQKIQHLTPKSDPLLKLLTPVWQKIQKLSPPKKKLGAYLFFHAFREGGLPCDWRWLYETTPSFHDKQNEHFQELENFIATRQLRFSNQYNLPLESREKYYSAVLSKESPYDKHQVTVLKTTSPIPEPTIRMQGDFGYPWDFEKGQYLKAPYAQKYKPLSSLTLEDFVLVHFIPNKTREPELSEGYYIHVLRGQRHYQVVIERLYEHYRAIYKTGVKLSRNWHSKDGKILSIDDFPKRDVVEYLQTKAANFFINLCKNGTYKEEEERKTG